MNKSAKKELLKNRRVVEEINRHLWIESEKAGHDIGFDQAATDWLARFSKTWMRYHMPKKMTSQGKSTTLQHKKKSSKKSPTAKRKSKKSLPLKKL